MPFPRDARPDQLARPPQCQQVPILTQPVEQPISMQADLWPDAPYILLIGCLSPADTRTPRREEDCAAGRSDNCTTNLFVVVRHTLASA